MKQIIMDVLDDMSESQINLASETARKTIAGLISATLNDRGRWIEFDEQTLNGQRAKESWVCDICGKNTYDVEWDYIGSGTNHLGCELKIEMKNREIEFYEPISWGVAVVELFESVCEEQLIQPTFITNYPIEVSPLAKKNFKNDFG